MTEREKLIELLSKKIYPRVGADPAEVVADYLIANGVTVQEHGRWIDSQCEIIEGLYHEIRECSECGWTHDMVIEFNYCPNCGARMDGDGDG